LIGVCDELSRSVGTDQPKQRPKANSQRWRPKMDPELLLDLAYLKAKIERMRNPKKKRAAQTRFVRICEDLGGITFGAN
jgi:hypothetical protein